MSFLPQPISIQSILGKKRLIGNLSVQVIINETATDPLTITRQPTQTGASITDHAYKEPTSLSMRILQQDTSLVGALLSTFSGNGLAAIYQQFLDLQLSRQPFNIVTPKRLYKNMLISAIGQTTDKNTENILALDLAFQEIILVKIGVAQVAPQSQGNKKVTQQTQGLGKKSALAVAAQALGFTP